MAMKFTTMMHPAGRPTLLPSRWLRLNRACCFDTPHQLLWLAMMLLVFSSQLATSMTITVNNLPPQSENHSGTKNQMHFTFNANSRNALKACTVGSGADPDGIYCKTDPNSIWSTRQGVTGFSVNWSALFTLEATPAKKSQSSSTVYRGSLYSWHKGKYCFSGRGSIVCNIPASEQSRAHIFELRQTANNVRLVHDVGVDRAVKFCNIGPSMNLGCFFDANEMKGNAGGIQVTIVEAAKPTSQTTTTTASTGNTHTTTTPTTTASNKTSTNSSSSSSDPSVTSPPSPVLGNTTSNSTRVATSPTPSPALLSTDLDGLVQVGSLNLNRPSNSVSSAEGMPMQRGVIFVMVAAAVYVLVGSVTPMAYWL